VVAKPVFRAVMYSSFMDTLEIIRQIEQDEGLRAQLRAVLLGDELLGLPKQVAEMDLRLTTRINEMDLRLTTRINEMDLRLTTRLNELAKAQQETNRAVGALSTVIGGGVEEDAVAGIQMVARERGWRLVATPQPVDLGDDEVDVVGTAEDPNGKTVTFIVEAKVRLRPADVERFHASLPTRIARLGVSGTILPYCYGMRLYAGTNEVAENLGVGLLTWSAEPVTPRPFTA